MSALLLILACGSEPPPAGLVDRDRDGFLAGPDCDDRDPNVHPRAIETCDAIDQDCDGTVDDGLPVVASFADADGDGFGRGQPSEACGGVPSGRAGRAGDCDDAAPGVHPGATEVCDGVDQDCDGTPDGGLPRSDWYTDADGDGFGAGLPTPACGPPAPGAVPDGTDCDDGDPAVNPAATEVCSGGVDEDCDGLADDADGSVDPATYPLGWRDLDGDGFGSVPVRSCSLAGTVANDEDCADADPAIHPAAPEVCNRGIDDDCDLLPDEADPDLDPATLVRSYADRDGDGLGDDATATDACEITGVGVGTDCDDLDPQAGAPFAWSPDADGDGAIDPSAPPSAPLCEAPGPAYAPSSRPPDCDESRADVYPGATEVCDGGTDEDCDGLADDLDPSVDPATELASWVDGDGDGFGRTGPPRLDCVPPNGTSPVSGDCADGDPDVNPAATEVCDGGTDEDCDGDADDRDPDVDPASLATFWPDVDLDGAGDAATPVQACAAPPGHVADASDCDDLDPLLQGPALWLADADGDGIGAGTPVGGPACTAPVPGSVPEGYGLDCDDADPTISPAAVEACADGIDQDCDGVDPVCRTCRELLLGDPSLPSGAYAIEPTPGAPVSVWCDMTTDGGGWTLVGSTGGSPLRDEAGAWHADLEVLVPAAPHPGVWSELRSVVTGTSDLRFACKTLVGDAAMAVDLSFYGVPWYLEITTGIDGNSCFAECGSGEPPPARRDNLAGIFLPAGDAYGSGELCGEDNCGDTTDFTVDLDDRGMDSDQADGTDWGADDGLPKCGAGAGQAWFLFVREP